MDTMASQTLMAVICLIGKWSVDWEYHVTSEVYWLVWAGCNRN